MTSFLLFTLTVTDKTSYCCIYIVNTLFKFDNNILVWYIANR